MNNIKDDENYHVIATELYSKTKYHASKDDIKLLAECINVFKANGLEELNKKLLKNIKKPWDILSEFNFAKILVSQNSDKISIKYEDLYKGTGCRPDFKVIAGKRTYWIQVKNLSCLERENRQTNIVREIEREIKSKNISKGYFYSLELSNDFLTRDIHGSVDFIVKIANEEIKQDVINKEFVYKNGKAKIHFALPNNPNITTLQLGCCGDMNMVEETGLSSGQIKNSVIKAAKAFIRNSSKDEFNIIVLDVNNQEDIDICDAVFGTEYKIIQGRQHKWSRRNDGFFNMVKYSGKISTVITIKRKEKERPISDCFSMLYINENFREYLSDLSSLLKFDKFISFNDRPPSGKGNFEISR